MLSLAPPSPPHCVPDGELACLLQGAPQVEPQGHAYQGQPSSHREALWAPLIEL